MFSPHRLAPELPESQQTPERDFPFYFHSPAIPIAPPNWSLRVGGLVQRPIILNLDQLRALPATQMRVRHYCVNRWSAVASWRGVPEYHSQSRATRPSCKICRVPLV
jgi:DMSO/TMAO reductase YedYZ molybdopterin-dependent catalytic subunit